MAIEVSQSNLAQDEMNAEESIPTRKTSEDNEIEPEWKSRLSNESLFSHEAEGINHAGNYNLLMVFNLLVKEYCG
jgi:hypothetical protein